MHGFRYSFTPLTGVLFTFRSRYYFAIGHQVVLSLAGWAPRIHARFHETGATREISQRLLPFAYGAITHYGPAFQLVPLDSNFVTLLWLRNATWSSHDTGCETPAGYHAQPV